MHRKLILGFTGAFIIFFALVGGLIFRGSTVEAATCSSLGFNIARTSSSVFYVNTGLTPPLTNMYVGYEITNNTGTAYDDLWIDIGNFSGGVVTLASKEDGRLHVGPLANGATTHAYFYLKASGDTASAQTHSVLLYDTRPDLASGDDCSAGFSLTVEETIKANANKVNSVVAGPNPPELGGIVTMTVTGATGVNGTGEFYATPAAFDSWDAQAYQLMEVSVTFTGGNTGTFNDILAITGMNSPDSDYTITYLFQAITVTVAPTSVSPVNYIGSGTQIKHTNTASSTYTALAPIEPATNKTLFAGKTVSPVRLLTGGTATYTVSIQNTGSVVIALDDIVDSLPSSPDTTSYVTGTSKFNGSTIPDPYITGQTLTWINYFSVPAGTTRNLVYDVLIPNTDGIYENSVVGHISSTQIDLTLDTSDNAPASVDLIVGSLADVQITKSDSVDPIYSGNSLTYTLVVTNDGPDDTTGVSLVDTLPSETSYTSYTSTQGTCTHLTGTVTCALGDISNGGTATVTITVGVTGGTSGTITNNASVSAIQNDNVSSNDSAAENTVVITQTDVGVAKSDSVDPVTAGNNLTYTITANNNGPYGANNVTITDTIPGSVSYVSATPTQGSCSEAGGTVTCNLGTIANATTASVDIVVSVNSGASGSLSNSASVVIDEEDTVNGNNSSSENTSINKRTDLAVTKSDSIDPAIAGGSLTYVVNVTNNGPSDATGVSITDTLPSSVSVTSITPSQGTCSQGVGTISCSIGALVASTSATVTIQVDIDSNTGTSISNSVIVSGTETDPTSGNNSDSESTTITTSSDLSITKSDTPDPVIAGNNISYVLTTTNNGPSDAGNVQIIDVLPGNVTYVNAVPSQGSCSEVTGTVTCDLGTIIDGGNATVTITATVSNLATGTISNTATVSSDESDPTPGNNSATQATTINVEANLSITKVDSNDPAVAGNSINYTLSISNLGPSSATNVQVIDILPGSVLYNSSTPSQGACTHLTGTVTCNLGSMANGGSATVTVNVTISQAATGSISNTATVSSSEVDPSSSNNSATEPTTLIAQTDLSITKIGTPDPVIAGENLTYTIGISNLGPSRATGVSISDSIPSGTAYVSSTPSSGSCSFSLGVLSCTIGTINSGASESVSLVLAVNSAVTGSILNTTTVSGSETDPNNSNNSASETTVVNSSADISITKADSADPAIAGNSLTYTIQVQNAGPSSADSVQVIDNLPAQLEYVSVSSTQGSCSESSGVVTCNLGGMTVGGSAEVTIITTIDNTYAGSISNTATVSTTTSDPSIGNNSATEGTVSNKSVDLEINKSDSSDPIIAGESLVYTLDVINNGPSQAVNVVVTDVLPTELTYNLANTTQGSCSEVSGTITCTVGNMNPGQSETIVISVDVDINASGVITNTATITANESDSQLGNNSASETTSINVGQAFADIKVTKTVSHLKRFQGQPLTYTITVKNKGPDAATDVVLQDIWPSLGLNYTGGVPSVGTFNDQTLRWRINSLSVNQQETLTISAVLNFETFGNIQNIFKLVSLDEEDPVSANNSAEVYFVGKVRAEVSEDEETADLGITKVDLQDPIFAENPRIDYVIEIYNDGPSAANNIVITDTLPEETSSLISYQIEEGECEDKFTSESELVCTIDTLESGQSVRLLLSINISSLTKATVQNIVSISSATSDVDLSNNTSIQATSYINDVSVTEIISPEPSEDIPNSNEDSIVSPVVALVVVAGGVGLGWIGLFILGFFRATNPMGVVLGNLAFDIPEKIKLARSLRVKYYRPQDLRLEQIFKNKE